MDHMHNRCPKKICCAYQWLLLAFVLCTDCTSIYSVKHDY